MIYHGKKYKKAKLAVYVPEVTKKKMDKMSYLFDMTQSDMMTRAVEDLYEKLLETEAEIEADIEAENDSSDFEYEMVGTEEYELETTTEMLKRYKKKMRIESEVNQYEKSKKGRVGRLKRSITFSLSPALSEALEEIVNLYDISVRSIMTLGFILFLKEHGSPFEPEEE